MPPAVRERTGVVVLDTLGAMVAAASPRYRAAAIMREFAGAQGGTPDSTLCGGGRVPAVNAALCNATLAYYCDIEPHHTAAIMHSPAAVVPTALAFAERETASGAEFLAAVIAGIEAGCRTSLALGPRALYARGFHPSAVAGAPGAAAAGARVLRLPPDALLSALALGGLQSSGLMAWESDPQEHSRPLNLGVAARNGATAALLAAAGLGSPPDIFAGKFGLSEAYSDGQEDATALSAGLGEDYAVMGLGLKQFACCAFLQPGVEALVSVLRARGLSATDLDSITLEFPAAGAGVIDDNPLKSHCAQYILPVAAERGTVTVDDILADRRSEPSIARLGARTRVVHSRELDPEFPARYTSVVEVVDLRGNRVTARVEHARGTPENPMTRAEVEEKFHRLTSPLLPRDVRDRACAAVARLEAEPDVGALVECLARAGVGP